MDLFVSNISMLTVAGVSDKIIKKIVGHKGQGVTEVVYTHFSKKQTNPLET